MLALGPAYRGVPRGAAVGLLFSGLVLLAWLLDIGPSWASDGGADGVKGGGKGGAPSATILLFTDFHLFHDEEEVNKGIRPYHSLKEVLRSAAARHPRPTALLLTGDFTNDNTRTSYTAAVALVRGSFPSPAVPVLFAPGNHEDPAALHDVFGAANGWFGATEEEPVVGFDVLDAWRVVLINTHAGGDKIEGRLPERASLGLRRELGKAREARRRVLVALHHPPVPPHGTDVPPWGRYCLADPEPLLEAVAEYPGVVALGLHGHLHTDLGAGGREGGGVRWLATPATCHQLFPTSAEWGEWEVDDKSHPGWRRVVLDADGTHRTEVHRVRLSAKAAPGE